ncbi:MAG: bifunctional folylpolyglutamate synthase/dihydrofolate synthase, partial [Nevskiales bacterium]|nr:bifunctional folylpolyglutamate synthase/dihydrofolate synthase [Nevskiales bacterium]
GKPVEAFCAVLAPQLTAICAGGLPSPRGLTGEDLARRARGAGVPVRTFPTVTAAFEQARAECGAGDTLLVCGSFLTVAAVTGLLNG